MTRRVATILGMALLCACGATSMREDLDRQAELVTLGGTVAVDGWEGASIVVAALVVTDDPARPLQVSDYVLLHAASARWSLTLAPHTYRIVAFEDVNGDIEYGSNERLAPWNDFADLSTSPGMRRLDLDLVISGPPPLGEVMPEVAAPTGASRSLYIGTVLPLEDPRFGAENGRLGMLEPLRFMEEVGAGLFLTEPYDPARIPVVFVHGISGYPQEFDALVAGLDRTRHQAWLAQYPSGFDLDLVSDYVDRAFDETEVLHAPPAICVVAHSMGGVVMRRALARYATHPERARVPLFVTIASPVGGHPGAAMGAAMSPVVLPVWRSLVPAGDFISHLYEAPLPGETRHDLFFAFGSDDARGDGVVPLTSQLRSEAQREASLVRGFPTSHVGILEDAAATALVQAELAAHCR